MEIDWAAPATANGAVHIEAEPQTVFSVLAAIGERPSWNREVKWVKISEEARPGTEFRWRSGGATLRSRLEVVDAPWEIGWIGKTMGVTAVHVFVLEPNGTGTQVRSDESWDGLLARMLKSYSRRTIVKAITGVLAQLKTEAERRAVGRGVDVG